MFCFAAPLLWTKNVPVLTFWCSVDAVFAMAHSLHNLVIDKCCLGRLFQVIILNLEKYPFAPLASEWKLTRKAQKMHKLGTLWKIQSGIIHFGKVHPPTKICLYFAEFNCGYILVNGALVVIWMDEGGSRGRGHAYASNNQWTTFPLEISLNCQRAKMFVLCLAFF